MSFMGAINGMRDRNVIKNAYRGVQASGEAPDGHDHTKLLRNIGRQAAENGWSLDEAYTLYEEYIESLDPAVEEEQAIEGDDPGNIDYEDDEL